MVSPSSMPDPIIERGQQFYEQRLRAILEPHQNGNYVVIDVDSGDYEVDANHLAAYRRAASRHPGKVFYAARVGYPALMTLGGGRMQRP